MPPKKEQLRKDLKEAITNYRVFVIKNQQRNDIVNVSDIQFDERSITYSDADISSLDKCTGGTFKGMLRLHFKSDVNDECYSMVYRIVHGDYTVEKYENGKFNISINSIVCD